MSNINTDKAKAQAKLEARLGYEFGEKSLLDQALTHKSHSRRHNERLEFLGDAVLGFVIAQTLYSDHASLNEDALTLIRADLVRGETLAGLATGLQLGEFINLGSGEQKSGGRQRASILADALEAIIGAVSQDGGFEAVRTLILKLYSDLLAGVGETSIEMVKDAKTQLQELLQADSLPLPAYEVIDTRGSDHRRTFTVACRVESLQLSTTGEGQSRRAAEKIAAQSMIERLKV